MELWKAIPGYEGIYEASNHGNIRSAENKATYSQQHGMRIWQQRILKPRKDKQNCLRVTLWKNGIPKDYLLARLVCGTWHENFINTGMTVNHIDGNRLNNSASNLEWLTRGDNIRHGFNTGLYNSVRKGVELVDRETGARLQFNSMADASRAIGRNNGYVSLCVQRGCIAAGIGGQQYRVTTVKE